MMEKQKQEKPKKPVRKKKIDSVVVERIHNLETDMLLWISKAKKQDFAKLLTLPLPKVPAGTSFLNRALLLFKKTDVKYADIPDDSILSYQNSDLDSELKNRLVQFVKDFVANSNISNDLLSQEEISVETKNNLKTNKYA